MQLTGRFRRGLPLAADGSEIGGKSGAPTGANGMLVTVSKKVTACYERASACRTNAERQSDDEIKKAFLRIEESWLNLARHFEHSEQVARFLTEAQHATGALVFRCPETGREMNPGIETSYESLSGAWAQVVQVQCEHCGGEHPIPVRDGYIRSGRPDPG
jgi:hypothetical protein